MLRPLATTLLASLALASTASADRFFVGTPESEAKLAHGANYIEGVLIRTTDEEYVIRILNGEIRLPKSMVYKIEQDGLTVEQLEKREADRAATAAEANVRRAEARAEEAALREEEAIERARVEEEAPKTELTIVVDFQGALPGYRFKTYDPVLHRADFSGLRAVIEDYLRRQVERAAHRTPSRRW